MKLHLPTTLKAALIAAVLFAGSYPALGVTSTTTQYTYTPAGGEEQTITFNGDIWTWNNNTNNTALSDYENTYTNYSTNGIVHGRDVNSRDFTNDSFLYNFFNANENDRVGNTLRFDESTTDRTLNTDWTNYVWIGGIITEASDNNITYTFGRNSTTNFKLKGTGNVNLLLNSSFTLQTQTGPTDQGTTYSVSVEKSGTWTVASGKTFTITTNKTTLAANQAVNINGGGTVAIGSTLEILSGSSINVAAGSTVTVSGATTNTGTITNNGNLTFEGNVTLSNEFIIQQIESITSYSEGTNGYAQGQFVIVSGAGTTTFGTNATVVDSTSARIVTTTLADGSLATASDFTSCVYFVNDKTKTKIYAAASDLPAGLYIKEGASAEVTGVLDADVNHVYGSGTLKVHLDDTVRNLGSEEFRGKLHVEGSSSARGLLYTGNVVGENATVELGTRGQIVMTNGDTFANDIVIDSNVDANVAEALKSTIYTNSGQSGTVTGSINLNGKTLIKQGGGTLYIDGDEAVDSLLGGSQGSTFTMRGGGTVQIGKLNFTTHGDNFTTNLVVESSTLKIAASKSTTKTFTGNLTLADGVTVQQLDGGSKFTGAIKLGTDGGTVGNITLSANWGKTGIELAGTVSGDAKVYLVGGGSLDNPTTGHQTINISGSDNAFSGTYFVGVNSNGSASATKVHLIAGAERSLAHASVNLSGGEKAVLSLASTSATVAGLNGIAGSSIVTSATGGATLTVEGGGSYAGSFNNVNLTKQGAEATLTLTADTLTNKVTVEGGTLSLTSLTLTWGEGASVAVHSGNKAKLEMGANRGISVTAHAPAVATFAAGDANAATVTGSSIRNADITLTSADDHISQTVSDSSIINNSGTKQTVQVGASVAEVFANTGDIDLLTGDASTLTATKVHIGSGKTVGIYQGTTNTPGEMASLKLGDLVTDGTATLNAKVTSLNALTLGDVLTMGSGSSLALNDSTIYLSDAFARNLITGEGEFTLIEGIPGLSYEGAILNTDNLSGDYAYSLGTVTGDGGTESLVITAKLVPEPATATLSLLALAALAARRRRK